jgi:hypothetical protein
MTRIQTGGTGGTGGILQKSIITRIPRNVILRKKRKDKTRQDKRHR